MKAYLHTAIIAAALALSVGPASADTILHLSDTETVVAHPDELVASLRAEAVGLNAAAAQQVVNSAMASALARAKQIPGVDAATEGYTAWQATEPHRWQASQTLVLRSHDGPTLLTLVGELQQHGLAMSDLSWQLSPEAASKARDQALREALGKLQGRAEEAAGLLGLRFQQFQRVSIASPRPVPFAPRAMMSAAMAAAPTPPSAQAQEVPVSATADADAVLLPK
ncbi:MAG: SIMPL domain-containing protein [Acetobacteraceae bacterium]